MYTRKRSTGGWYGSGGDYASRSFRALQANPVRELFAAMTSSRSRRRSQGWRCDRLGARASLGPPGTPPTCRSNRVWPGAAPARATQVGKDPVGPMTSAPGCLDRNSARPAQGDALRRTNDCSALQFPGDPRLAISSRPLLSGKVGSSWPLRNLPLPPRRSRGPTEIPKLARLRPDRRSTNSRQREHRIPPSHLV